MAFKRPGVYVTETLTPLAQSVDTGTSSTAVFVGTNAAGGPTTPTLVTSWTQFTKVFGGFGNGADLLPFSVFEFFNNGGSRCYVIRAAASDAKSANWTLKDGSADVLKVTAMSAGKWGNNITVDVVASAVPSHFDFLVTANGSTERYADVSLDPSSSRFLPNIVNSPYAGSALVTVQYVGPASWSATNTPVPVAGRALTTGTDGAATADVVTAAQALDNVIGIFDVNLPGVSSATAINTLSAWAEASGNIFLIVDGVVGNANDLPATNAGAQITSSTGYTPSSTVAVYGPWLVTDDPLSTVPGAQRLLPPGGFVMGQFSRTDTIRGVQKPAAGIETTLRGVLGPQFLYSQSDLDTLNVAGVNVLKVIPGAGTCIFGARTRAVGMPDRYLSVRRSLISLKFGLVNLTRFAVFEENDAELRSVITDLCSQYLRTAWSQGVLAGATEAQAFLVQCDDQNNDASDVQQGVINVTIGVSLQTPAEFIIFNIGQTLSGTSVDES